MATWQVLLLLGLLSAVVWTTSTLFGGRRRLRGDSRVGQLGAPSCWWCGARHDGRMFIDCPSRED